MSLGAGDSCSIPPLIRLRRTLERGRKHPILGPIVLVLLVLLLAMVFLHAAYDDHGAAPETGFVCLAIVILLGSVVVRVPRRELASAAFPIGPYRGPPARSEVHRCHPFARGPSWRAAPLRR